MLNIVHMCFHISSSYLTRIRKEIVHSGQVKSMNLMMYSAVKLANSFMHVQVHVVATRPFFPHV